MEPIFDRVENVEKGENDGHQHFLLFNSPEHIVLSSGPLSKYFRLWAYVASLGFHRDQEGNL